MTTARLWATLIGVSAALAWAPGCSEVESCVEGIDEGCRNSHPDDSLNCRFGLKAVQTPDGLLCLRASEAADGGQDGPEDDAGGGNDCSCPSGNLCREDGACVDVCQPLTNVPAYTPKPLTCRPLAGQQPFTYERAALGLCYQACVRGALICGVACDPSVECTPALAVETANDVCLQNPTPECAMQVCEAVRDQPCAQTQCPPGITPNCAGVLCSNTCDMPEFNNDGYCDDGDLSNAESYVCPYGTDCGDCGPRRGSAASIDLQYGDPCVDPFQCGGDVYHVKTSTGWCATVTDGQDYARCLPDCSNGKRCPAGYECSTLGQDMNGDGVQETVVDVNDGTEAAACFPIEC